MAPAAKKQNTTSETVKSSEPPKVDNKAKAAAEPAAVKVKVEPGSVAAVPVAAPAAPAAPADDDDDVVDFEDDDDDDDFAAGFGCDEEGA